MQVRQWHQALEPVNLNHKTPKTIHYKVEEPKEESCFDPRLNSPKHCKKPTDIKKGDVINLVDLLFTKDRDYLIKCNDSQQVNAEHLAGKVVIIYLDSISQIDMKCMTSLMRVYNDLQPKNSLEVVFVDDDVDPSVSKELSPNSSDQRDHRKHLKYIFTRMPWTAIPLSDITQRKYLKQRFGAYGQLFIVDSMGKIVQEDQYVISEYGALGYPFTDERINFLYSEDVAVARKPSLQTLLASPERDYLITNKQDKVPIYTLVDKVVALYFYEEGVTSEYTTLEIKMAYEELTKNKENFEVVLIYVYDTEGTCHFANEKSFWKSFKTMPWLALPFSDLNYVKLKRIFDYGDYGCYDRMLDYYCNTSPKLAIIGPHFEFFEPFAHSILSCHSISAFPFSREKVANLFAKKAKELKLDMLWDPNSVFGGEVGSRVRFCQVVGKKVIVMFDMRPCGHYVGILTNLKEKYIQLKDTDDKFEVIHIIDVEEYNEDAYDKHNANLSLPWSVHPLVGGCSLAERLFHDFNIFYDAWTGFCDLIAFDEDGNLVRIANDPVFEDTSFPFYSGGLEKEAIHQVVDAYNLDRRHYLSPGKIYSYNRNYEDVFEHLRPVKKSS